MQTNKNRRPCILTGIKSDENLVIGVLKGEIRVTVMTVPEVFAKTVHSILVPLDFLT